MEDGSRPYSVWKGVILVKCDMLYYNDTQPKVSSNTIFMATNEQKTEDIAWRSDWWLLFGHSSKGVWHLEKFLLEVTNEDESRSFCKAWWCLPWIFVKENKRNILIFSLLNIKKIKFNKKTKNTGLS